jgi:hypothetical protein
MMTCNFSEITDIGEGQYAYSKMDCSGFMPGEIVISTLILWFFGFWFVTKISETIFGVKLKQ